MARRLAIGLILAISAVGRPGLAAKNNDFSAQLEKRAEGYVASRKNLAKKLPKLGEKASPEEITAHQSRLRELVRAERANAKPRDILGAGIFEIVSAVRSETGGAEDRDAARTVLGEGNPAAEGKGFAPRVNARYPEGAPRSTVPPDLLAKLPTLPEGLEYRFVGRTLILYDAEADLIVDYVSGAVKGGAKR